jgi:hypothetical protein
MQKTGGKTDSNTTENKRKRKPIKTNNENQIKPDGRF